MKINVTFAEWCEQLWALCVKHDWPFGEPSDWLGYWQDEYTPKDALLECMSYAEAE